MFDLLFLDVRNNQGGDFEAEKFLPSYLFRKSIKYLPHSKEFEIVTPKKIVSKGTKCILINGGIFFSTGILCSYPESTKRGISIGEETAGNKIIIRGNPMNSVLPNTKNITQMSTTRYVIRNNYYAGHGFIAAYYTTSTIKNIITRKVITKDLEVSIISKKMIRTEERYSPANYLCLKYSNG